MCQFRGGGESGPDFCLGIVCFSVQTSRAGVRFCSMLTDLGRSEPAQGWGWKGNDLPVISRKEMDISKSD